MPWVAFWRLFFYRSVGHELSCVCFPLNSFWGEYVLTTVLLFLLLIELICFFKMVGCTMPMFHKSSILQPLDSFFVSYILLIQRNMGCSMLRREGSFSLVMFFYEACFSFHSISPDIELPFSRFIFLYKGLLLNLFH